MSANASLTIVGGPQRITPGQTTTLTAQIVNLGTVPDDFRLSVRQLDPAWVIFRPPTVFLHPGAQATAEIAITPPTNVSPEMLHPIFRLLSRRAGNIAIVEIAMPVPQPAPIYEAPVRPAPPPPTTRPYTPPVIVAPPEDEEPAWTDDDEDTGPVPDVSARGETPRRTSVPPLFRIFAGIVTILLLVAISVFALTRRASAPTLTATAGEATAPAALPTPTEAPAPAVVAPTPAPTTAPPTATAPAVARIYVVANTGGQGVYLRRTANIEDRDTAYADGTALIQVGPDVQAGGLTWHHVRAPDGKVGFVPAQYTTLAP